MNRIVAYRADHFDGIDRLWHTVFPDDPARNRASAAIPAKLAMNDGLLWVAEGEAGEVIGSIMAGWDGHRGWLYAVAIDPGAQGNGIGRALVATALERLAELGCAKVNLQVREDNVAVIGFYRRLGFVVEPRISLGRAL